MWFIEFYIWMFVARRFNTKFCWSHNEFILGIFATKWYWNIFCICWIIASEFVCSGILLLLLLIMLSRSKIKLSFKKWTMFTEHVLNPFPVLLQGRLVERNLYRMSQNTENSSENHLICEFAMQTYHERFYISACGFFHINLQFLGSVTIRSFPIRLQWECERLCYSWYNFLFSSEDVSCICNVLNDFNTIRTSQWNLNHSNTPTTSLYNSEKLQISFILHFMNYTMLVQNIAELQKTSYKNTVSCQIKDYLEII